MEKVLKLGVSDFDDNTIREVVDEVIYLATRKWNFVKFYDLGNGKRCYQVYVEGLDNNYPCKYEIIINGINVEINSLLKIEFTMEEIGEEKFGELWNALEQYEVVE